MLNAQKPILIESIRKGVFNGLPTEYLNDLLQASAVRRVQKGQSLESIIGATHSLQFLIKGQILVFSEVCNGNRFIVSLLEGGSAIGHELKLESDNGANDLYTNTEVLLLSVNKAQLKSDILRREILMPDYLERIGEQREKIYLGQQNMLYVLSNVGISARLAALILHIWSLTKDSDGRLPVRLSQNQISSMCLGSRQRVNRFLGIWVSDGILQRRDRVYFIKNFSKLEELADS